LNFKLRPWHISDLNSLVKYANNFNISKNLTNKFPHPYTDEDGKHFIEFATAENPVHIFAIEINGEAAGGIGIHPQVDIFCKNAELGYWLAESFWGHKVLSRAIEEAVKYGFETFNIDRIFARPFGTNIASQKVLEKNNFILEGRYEKTLFKNGEYFDELVYAIRRENWIGLCNFPF
jgi:[ribosomal protein S5]-alanine N-acetyltransferase